MKILVIGGGGREHALVWKLKQSPRVREIFCAPGNAGTAAIARNVPLKITDTAGLLKFARDEKIDLTVVGPDDALAAGIADVFQEAGLRIFGPTKNAARFEWSKIFAKEFMKRHGLPTAAFGHFSKSEDAHAFCQKLRYPVVIKADGLALGKGVVIAQNSDDAAKTIYRMMEAGQFGAAGRQIVIEEFLRGPECSIHALLDGRSYLLCPAIQDYKRAFDNNEGPNTGGMGTFCPSPLLTDEMHDRVHREVMLPFMRGLQEEGLTYKGLLYPGLLFTDAGEKVLEFNCRFGDPETQSLLPRLKSDLLDLIESCVDGRLEKCLVEWDTRAAVCVVMASGGYPGTYETGKEITGLNAFNGSDDVVVFHAGTKMENGKVVTSGGRVLGVTALGDTLKAARKRAYEAVEKIKFEGAHFRTDIAALP